MSGKGLFAGAQLATTPTTDDSGSTTFKLQVDTGAGGAASIADGSDVAEGAKADAAYSDSTGAVSGSLVALHKGQYVLTAAMSAKLPASLGIKTAAASLSIAPASDASFVVAGGIADAATDSGNSVKVGGVYNSTPPTLTTGQRGKLQLDVNGNLQTRLMITSGSVGDAVPAANSGTLRSQDNTTNLMLTVVQNVWNATGYDRQRTITGAVADGTGLGVLAVEQAGALFSNIATATTTTVKSGKGILHKIVMNTYVASATITIYDNTAGSGTKIGTLTLPSTITSDTPVSLPYDLQFSTGLTLVTSGATDLTVIYR